MKLILERANLLPTFCLFATMLIAPVYSQDEESDDKKKARGRVAWIIYTSLPKDMENPVTLMSGKKLTELTLSKRSTSNPVKVPADGILKIVRKLENPQEFEQLPYQTIAGILIPQGVSKALVILSPLEKPNNGLIFESKVMNLASFKGGDNLYLNITPVKIGVQLGEQKKSIEPNKSEIIAAPSLTKSKNVVTRYSYFDSAKKKWRLLSASTVVLRPTRREICIFSWDERYKRVGYHGITFPVMR